MPVKNRNQRDPGRFRVHIACPVCGSGCLIKSSVGQTILSRMSYVRCTNTKCGWGGVALTEIMRTLSPSSGFYGQGDAPPMVDGEFVDAIKADIEAESQDKLI